MSEGSHAGSFLRVVGEADVRQVLTRSLAYAAVKEAFESVSSNESRTFDVVIAEGPGDRNSFAIKSATDDIRGITGFKVGSYWPGNVEMGLRAHAATTLLLDPHTGFPSILVNATLLNGFRTAAADAVATDALARPDASILAVIGAGHQAEQEIRALLQVRSFSEIRVSTRSSQRAEWLRRQLKDLPLVLNFCGIREAVEGADVIVTVTPSREPLIRCDWVSPGTHISAMGADAPGKQELDPDLLTAGRLFADHPPQSLRIGEFQHLAAMAPSVPSRDQITPIGRVTLGQVPGRVEAHDITIFDSSGLAVQDILIAQRVAEAARALGRVSLCGL